MRDLGEFLWMMTLILARLLSFTQLLLLILNAMLRLFRLLEGIRIDLSGVLLCFSRNFKKNMAGREYPSSHNHGSGKWEVSNFSFLSFSVIFHFHDYGRKGIDLEKVSPFTGEYVWLFLFDLSPHRPSRTSLTKKRTLGRKQKERFQITETLENIGK